MRTPILCFAFLFLFLASSVFGSTTYFVRLTGDDTTGDGSLGNPWRTVQKAVNSVANGVLGDPNVIDVGAGQFAESYNGVVGRLQIVNKQYLRIQGAGAKAAGGTQIGTTDGVLVYQKANHSGVVWVSGTSKGIEFQDVILGEDRSWSDNGVFFQPTLYAQDAVDVTLNRVHISGPLKSTLIAAGINRSPTAVRAASSTTIINLNHVLVTGHGSYLSNPEGKVFAKDCTFSRLYGIAGSDDHFMFLQTPAWTLDDPRYTFEDCLFYELEGAGGGGTVRIAWAGGGVDNVQFDPTSEGGDNSIIARAIFNKVGPVYYTDLGNANLFERETGTIMKSHGVFVGDDTALAPTGNLAIDNSLSLLDWEGFSFVSPMGLDSGWMTQIPEPGTVALVVLGGLGFVAWRRRRP